MKFDTKQNFSLSRNQFGYMEVSPKPSPVELSEYYEKKYYQQEQGNYRKSYSAQEKVYIKNKISQNLSMINLIRDNLPGKLLDIGCGEGFALSEFLNANWNVTGLDYSEFGCQQMNPHCVQHLISGDIYDNVKSLIRNNQKYDVIWLTNVLEHVIDPCDLLKQCLMLANENTVLLAQVPNDFSKYQAFLVENGHIPDQSWVAYPERYDRKLWMS